MSRTLTSDLHAHLGQQVTLCGYVDIRRDHGKLIFINLRDRAGQVQMVVLPNHAEALAVAQTLRPEWSIKIEGKVNARPPKTVKQGEKNGDIEIEVLGIEVLGRAAELPFELGTQINIDTRLDTLPLSLREPKYRALFKVQSRIVQSFREYFASEGFVEFQAPKLIGDDAEGGANSFNIEYFGHVAHLAQSPQLYKQIMVGVFERVFTVGNVFRAEKHATARHLNEYTSLDIEMGFVKDHTDVMAAETGFLRKMAADLQAECADAFALWGSSIPVIPQEIPSLTLRQAQKLITEATGKDCTKEPDLEPEHERWLCTYAQEKFGSEFIFVTHFPTAKRPFYTYRDEQDPTYTKGFDLLFRGVEITTGAQRLHDYNALVSSMQEKKLDPARFSYYLQAFKYGLPPHGGFGLGLERLTAKMVGIANVKEATLFPRDINRIDNLLSKSS
jgi:nondiscriminating aspartyl-tRNA synthetase